MIEHGIGVLHVAEDGLHGDMLLLHLTTGTDDAHSKLLRTEYQSALHEEGLQVLYGGIKPSRRIVGVLEASDKGALNLPSCLV